MKKRDPQRRIASRRFQVETLEARLLLTSAPDGALAVQLAPSAAVSDFSEVAATAGATVQATGVPGWFEVQGSGSSLAAVSAAVADDHDVLSAAPVQTEQASVLPNDPEFQNGDLYGLNGTYGINAPAAWTVTTGAPATVTIADLDTGADYDHPDLYQNIWINQAEIPTSRMVNLTDVYHDGYISWRDLNSPINIGPGKITDVNGDGVIDAGDILAPMVLNANGQDTGAGGWANPANTQDGDTAHPDDLIGWNFITNNNNPLDDHGHGTHTAGIIAAMGNNGAGVVGVNWSAQVMVVKMLDGTGNGTDTEAAAAIQYAANHGAKVANASWGAPGTDAIVASAINSAAAKNMVFVAAAGNSGLNIDVSPVWPAAAGAPNEIAVGATQSDGTRAGFSDYGPKTVLVNAPGVGIESTWNNNGYAYASGTSMAAPFVTGTVALVAGLHPAWSYSQLINQIETTTTGTILNAGAATAPVYPASASFVTTDTTAQGNWKSTYGGDGFDIAQDGSTNNPTFPAYATIALTGTSDHIWTGTTQDSRALQQAAAGSTNRLAACWFTTSNFQINVNLTDGAVHQIVLYALDWDNYQGGRSERFDLIDAVNNQVLDSRSISGFQNGEYLVWNVSGHVLIQVTNLNASANAVVSGLFLGSATTTPPTVASAAAASPNPVTGTTATLSVLGADPKFAESTLTYTWIATAVPAGAAVPSFSSNGTNGAKQTTVTFHQAGSYTFLVMITDPSRLTATSSVTVTVAPTLTAIAVTPASAAVFDGTSQSFAATARDQFGQPLAPQPAFTWSVDAGGAGGTITATGVYTGPARGGGAVTVRASSGAVSGTASVTVTAINASVTFVATDTTTQGSWKAAYGTDGFDLAQDGSTNNPTFPAYAKVALSGNSSYTWAGTSQDPRALQQAAAGSTNRLAACWYSASNFSIDVNFTDSAVHQIVLYALDWDNYQGGRSERLDVIDAASNRVLDSRSISGFQNGEYLVWNVSGHVTIEVTDLKASSNAVVSGLFLGGAPTVPSPGATVTFMATDTTTQGNWKAAYGTDGFDLAQDGSTNNPTFPAYAKVALSGNSSYTWAGTSQDSRALQQAAAGSTNRLAACWYSASNFSIDVNFTDGAVHQIVLYALDWDNYQGGRSERFDVTDAANGQVLDSRSLSGFQNGEYLVWNVSGHVTIEVTNLKASSNAVVSGLFFGPAG
jgi:subtilisin family serine protease